MNNLVYVEYMDGWEVGRELVERYSRRWDYLINDIGGYEVDEEEEEEEEEINMDDYRESYNDYISSAIY